MKQILLGLFFEVMAFHTTEATSCVASYVPLAIGSQSITSISAVTSVIFLAGTPKIEKNADVVCINTPPVASKAPIKNCNVSVTSSLNGSVSLGGKFGAPEWGSIGLSVSAGVSYTTACAALIDSWCQCCICVCYIPKTITTAVGVCNATCYISDYISYPCPVSITDTATSYGWINCTTTWDADGDGKDDCWNSMPKPCKTSCNTGS